MVADDPAVWAGAGATPTRIVIADDHAMVRSGLRRVADADDGFEVVGEAGATRLNITIRTVESHRAEVGQKLRLASRAELVRHAREQGLLDEHRGINP